MRNRRRPPVARWAAGAAAAYVGWQLLKRVGSLDLRDAVVLITGGSRGLGLLLGEEFAKEGAKLVICARDEQELDRARRRLEDECHADVLAVRTDISSREQVEELVAHAIARFGRVDVLVNNGSIIQVGPVESMTVEDFEAAMGPNFWGAVYATMAVLPQMRARRQGRIVNITSIGARVSIPHLVPYDCAKFATLGLSEGLRAELAKDGIKVTTIVPGLMRTGSAVNAFFKGQESEEYSWFSVASATPLTTMSARRAARRIVVATKRGEAQVTLTWQARLLGLTHDLFPGATANALGLVNRLLPADDGENSGPTRGMRLSSRASPSRLTGLMNRAARKYNQFGGLPKPSPEHAEQIGLTERPWSE